MIRPIEVVGVRRIIDKSFNTDDTCFNANLMEQRGPKMKFKEIKFNKTDTPNGIQAMIDFGEYDLSIVKSDFSYGGKSGLYEIAVFKGNGQVELPGITEQGDTVKGFLSQGEVEGIIKKMHLATGKEPKQVDFNVN